MRAKEIREISTEDLVVKCKELKEELFNLKFQLSLGQVTNTAKIREVRREIARINTIFKRKIIKS
ncbi:50S ribosomal protein L29 [Cetobacterium somerae]|uniref:50S ribosomal protein L29 n=1 Tax=Cetobacterium somerae TaxID=188913 RepID=UPI00211F1F51|nr:50S ribosomal protein L29 [Cetobacterium somerae]MCQ9628635.1 50S ribosomal protein L29 [Cetobacterium somerae]